MPVKVIDADTHVDETEDTWEFVQGEDARYKPIYQTSEHFDPSRPLGSGHYWVIDGRRQRRRVRSDEVTKTTKGTRELQDVDSRLRHMDQLGVDVHVIYPTMFCTGFTDKPDVELATKNAYNRWLADRTGRSPEARRRLRWVMLSPLMTMDKTIEQMRWAKDNGACGVMKAGDWEAGYMPGEAYFHPFYEEAQKLDLTICFHLGGALPDFTPAARFSHVGFYQNRLPIQNAFHALVAHKVPSMFPRLRFAMVEAGASWIPYLVYTFRRDAERRSAAGTLLGAVDYTVGENILKENRIYVTCQVDEDLPYILRYAGEDNLMVGSDYSHSDPSQEGDFADRMREWARRELLTDAVVDKILYDNAKTCYGL